MQKEELNEGPCEECLVSLVRAESDDDSVFVTDEKMRNTKNNAHRRSVKKRSDGCRHEDEICRMKWKRMMPKGLRHALVT